MSAADQSQTGGVVTGGSQGLPVSRRVLLLAAGTILLVVLLSGGAYFAMKHLPATTKANNTNKQQTRTPEQAISDAQSKLQQAKTPTEKAAAYNQLGDAYVANKQTSNAATAYNDAVSNAQSASDGASESLALSNLAALYMQAGDTANEIKAIQALIPLLDKSSNPDDKRLAFRYKSLLASLEAQ
jgi:cytochrome c-type biogenesis protein CcmH/NrfG